MTIASPNQMNVEQLLCLYSQILDELRLRGIVRSTNNPVGDFAENIAAIALKLTLVGNSSSGYDAISESGERYQIKSRRITAHNKSRQMSSLRRLEESSFDHLVGILFHPNFKVYRACVMPIETVRFLATPDSHVNGHRLLLRDEVWNLPSVRNITTQTTDAAELLYRLPIKSATLPTPANDRAEERQ